MMHVFGGNSKRLKAVNYFRFTIYFDGALNTPLEYLGPKE